MSLVAPKARRKAVSGSITARWRADARLLQLGKSLWLTGMAIQASKSPTTLVARRLSGKSGEKAESVMALARLYHSGLRRTCWKAQRTAA